jgi:hypothetical protein
MKIGLFVVSLFVFLFGWVSLADAQSTDQQLIDRFKPFIKSSVDGGGGEEVFRPNRWQWFVSNSTLLNKAKDGTETVVVPQTGWDLTDSPPFNFLITKGVDLTNGSEVSDMVNANYTFELKISSNAIHGEEWPDVALGHGVYGHVGTVLMQNNLPLKVISYTILWANNQDRLNGNQHDGDMTELVVVYDPSSDRIIRVIYPQHGCQVEEYDLVPGQMVSPANLSGKNILTSKSNNVAGVKVDFPSSNVSFATEGDCTKNKNALLGIGIALAPGLAGKKPEPDHHMFFVGDPLTVRFEHPVIFAENGTHESFPNQSGYIIDGGGHNGSGQSWLPQSVVTLEDLSGANFDDTPFVKYGGKVGTDGQSIVLHRIWCWPNVCDQNNANLPGSLFSEIDPYQTYGNTAWPPGLDEASSVDAYVTQGSTAGDGSQAHPYDGLGVALSFSAGRLADAGPSILHMSAGTYTLVGNSASVCKPITLRASNGPVLLQAANPTFVGC